MRRVRAFVTGSLWAVAAVVLAAIMLGAGAVLALTLIAAFR